MDNVRVRFAPSPTGPLHIGAVRTALYNYLFAKKNGGTFILRIEDTDQNRHVENAEKYIMDSLKWCGISFDECTGKKEKFGPYRQSERKHLYKKYIDELVISGNAYYAFDTTEELNLHRKNHEAKGKTFIYNWHNRKKLINSISLSKKSVDQFLKSGKDYVIRFKMYEPETEKTIIDSKDLVRGKISFKKELLDDKILFKKDGMPTYHFANVVDDYLMKISHVIRGEEWLPSLPLHISIYNAFGWKFPKFAHLPLILKPVGKGKLSKRDGDKFGFPVFPLEYLNEKTGEISKGYKEYGYFNDSFVNMLALLGWNPGTEQEIFSIEELIEKFSLSRINKSGAKFSIEKAKWFNQQYLQKKENKYLADKYSSILKKKNIKVELDYVEKVVSLIKNRAVFIEDFWKLSYFFFTNPINLDKEELKKQWKENTKPLMEELIYVLKGIENFSPVNTKSTIKKWIIFKNFEFKTIMQPFRICLVGALEGPDLFNIAYMIGKKETLKRIKKAIETLG